jgi:hypothetical protein
MQNAVDRPTASVADDLDRNAMRLAHGLPTVIEDIGRHATGYAATHGTKETKQTKY